MKWLFKLFLSLSVIVLCGHSMAVAGWWQDGHLIVSPSVRSSTEVKSNVAETKNEIQYFRKYKSGRNRSIVENVEDDNDETVNHKKLQSKGDFLTAHFSAQLYDVVSKNLNFTYPSHYLLSVLLTTKLYITFRVFRI